LNRSVENSAAIGIQMTKIGLSYSGIFESSPNVSVNKIRGEIPVFKAYSILQENGLGLLQL
jgi:hypothetical protein